MSSAVPDNTDRPPVRKIVLLPGLDGTGELFAGFVNAFSGTFHPVVVRYPVDSCRSYEQVMQYLESLALDTEPFVLLGESFSSRAAIAWAASHPHNVRGLIISVGFASPPVSRWLRPIYSLLSPIIFAIPRPAFAIRTSTAGSDAPTELLQKMKKIRAAVPTATFGARLKAVLTCDARKELAKVNVPVLLLHAQQDRLIGRKKLEEMKRLQPRADVEVLPGPHLILQRHPQQAAQRIERSIRERIDSQS